ncbi:MAG: hypothetical protein M1814_003300 [Vezdaea aestivalis]|nr:MAG: hypothetical protein M1814_003300 [Vezdaea aestivalis]
MSLPFFFKFICPVLLLGQLPNAIADGVLPSTALNSALSATSVLVTATTGTHPVFTFTPSQNPQYTTITQKTTTTDKDHHIVVIFPFGWVWAPAGPPGIPPPEPPTAPPEPATPTPTPSASQSDPGCKTTAPPECMKTVSYVSVQTGYTQTIFGDCPKPSGCVSSQVTKSTTIHTQLPYASASIPPVDGEPSPVAVSPGVISFFEQSFTQQQISEELPHNPPSCPTDQVSSADNVFFKALAQKFCDATAKNGNTKPFSIDLDGTALSKRDLRARTPPPGSQEYQGFKFHYEWKPKTGFCLQDCTAAFSSIAAECGHFGRLVNGMKMTGSLDVGCGEYSWKITEPPPPVEKDCSFPNNPPECYGLDTPMWVENDAAHQFSDIYCTWLSRTEGYKRGPTLRQEYNKDTDKWMEFDAEFQERFTVDYCDCKALISSIIDDCDGNNPDNVSGGKHGGAVHHPKGATISFIPRQYREIECAEPSTNTFTNDGILDGNIKDFCTAIPKGGATKTYNDNSVNAVELSVKAGPDTSISSDDCNSRLGKLITQCNTGVSKFRHGGVVTIKGNEYAIKPKTVRFPIKEGSDFGSCSTITTGDKGLNGGLVDKSAVQQCLLEGRSSSGPTTCDRIVKINVDLVDWDSPEDCYTACINCLSDAVDKGATSAFCSANKDLANCSMRFQIL